MNIDIKKICIFCQNFRKFSQFFFDEHFRMSNIIAPINFYEDGQKKDGKLEITSTQLVFKSGMFDETKLAYPSIKLCHQDDAQKIKSQLDIITKVRNFQKKNRKFRK